jgi:hypothetical protein
MWEKVVTSEHKNSKDELRALFRAFLQIEQLPYHATDRNSNTYARHLLETAKFKVADRHTDYVKVTSPGRPPTSTEVFSLNPADSYEKAKATKISGIFNITQTGSTNVGPTSTPGWSNIGAYRK